MKSNVPWLPASAAARAATDNLVMVSASRRIHLLENGRLTLLANDALLFKNLSLLSKSKDLQS